MRRLRSRQRLPPRWLRPSTETRGASWPFLFLGLRSLEIGNLEGVALPGRDGQPLSFRFQQAGQVEDLPHVIGRMGHRAQTRLAYAHRFAADGDRPVEI